MPYGDFDLDRILDELQSDYKNRGVNLFSSDNKYYFKTSTLTIYDGASQ